MVDTDISWLGAVLAKRERENSIVKIISMETEPASKVGDNYASLIVRATLKVILGSGKCTTKRLILKKNLPNISQELSEDMVGIFVIEGMVYEKILAALEALISKQCLTYSKFWPDCYYASPNVIIFEDLRASSFTLRSRHKGADKAHSSLVVSSLARLHSLSVVALAEGSIYRKITPQYLMAEPGFIGETFFRVSMKSLADVIRDLWGPEWTPVERKIRIFMNEVIPILGRLCKEPHKLDVINHGDCWLSNMMFKYDSEGSPVELKFFDFQVSHHNSYAWDLTYFLHSSVRPQLLESWKEDLIKIYSNEFKQNLARLDFDTSVAPTVDEVTEELNRLQLFALAVSTSILPVAANPSDVEITLGELLDDKCTKFRKLFENKEFEATIQTMLKSFVKLDVFSKII